MINLKVVLFMTFCFSFLQIHAQQRKDSTRAEQYYAIATSGELSLDSSIYFLEQISSFYKRDTANLIDGKVSLALGLWHADIQNFQASFTNLNKAEKNFSELFKADHIYNKYVQINKGKTHADTGDYINAINYYLKSIFVDTVLSSDQKQTVYNNLGNAYSATGDIQNAIDFFKLAISIKSDRTWIYKSNYGDALLSIEEYDKAIDLFQQSINEYQDEYNKINDLARPYHNSGLAHMGIGQYERALPLLQKGLELRKKFWKDSASLDVGRTLRALGDWYINQGKFEKALSYLSQALVQQKDVIPNLIHPQIAWTLQSMSELYLSQKKYELALTYQDSAVYSTGYDGKDFQSIRSRREWIDAMALKSKILFEKAKADEDRAIAILARDNYILTNQGLDYIRKRLGSELSISKLMAQYRQVINDAVNVHIFLKEFESVDNGFGFLFDMIQSVKSYNLTRAVERSGNLSYFGIPDNLIEREKELKLKITFAGEGESNSNLDSLTFYRQAAARLEETFEKNYSKYYAFKYAVGGIDHQKLKTYLKDHSDILVYDLYMADDYIVAYSYKSNDRVNSSIIKLTEKLDKDISFLSNYLKNDPYIDPFNETDFSINYRQYLASSNDLYKNLFQMNLTDERAKQIVFIPDSKLHDIPFEVLLTNDVHVEEIAFRNLSFLFRDYAISYEYSPALLYANKSEQKVKYQYEYAGIAPSYENVFSENDLLASNTNEHFKNYVGQTKALGRLKYSIPEVEEASQYFNPEVTYIGEEARAARFFDLKDKSKILHFSMHGVIDNENPNNSHLLFSYANDKDSLDHKLMASELYNIEIDAKLAVLSACQTGAGNFDSGEGIMSLSRAFKYAGCPEVVLSKWKANEFTSKKLMVAFFKNLADGQSNALALKEAKEYFLTKDKSIDERYLHPYYWSNFALIGSDGRIIDSRNSYKKWWIYVLVGSLLLFGFLFVRSQYTRSVS